MESISPECQGLKEKYDKCFNAWFRDKFLKGSRHDSCAPLLKSYQQCVKKALKEQGIKLWEGHETLGTDKEKRPPKNG
ncbi:hypothetical protein CAPTEDRAFT_98355 [Capitella teleta]|uniref:TP53 regulated inhibitor of apoptosis 1 n=1 Tax=Capitella teleta TaxID=283909 RepID=R7V4D9_CAPTE|nr:hypothetical protein CAPTEDRAFT_98355 [Capitella teleta]|eukprot:ELU13688.1 hypothetical protein CAPTEDRAFT_98355 [Capitella teleta]